MDTARDAPAPDQVHHEPTASDMMRTAVLAVEADESVTMAYGLVRRAGSGIAVVLRRGRPISIVDEQRLYRATLHALVGHRSALGEDSYGDLAVARCLPDRCVRVPAQAGPARVAERLLMSPVGAVLVEDGGAVVGVVTTTDLLAAMSGRTGLGARGRGASAPDDRDAAACRRTSARDGAPALFRLEPVLT